VREGTIFCFQRLFIKTTDEAEVQNDDPETTKVIQESRIRRQFGPPRVNADGSAQDRFAEEDRERNERLDKITFDIGGDLPVLW
jgi:hypothetical protein